MSFDNVNDFKKIYVLKTISTEGSFRKAAQKLSVTPSAVSQSISSLEKSLGRSLVIRDKNSTKLTGEALNLIEKAEPAFSVMKDILVKDEVDFVIKYLDLGIFESLASSYLPSFIKVVREEHIGCKFNIVIGRSAKLVQKLRSGELCTTLLIESEEMENIKKEFIASDSLGIFISNEFRHHEDFTELVKTIGLGSMSPGTQGHPIFYKKFLNSLKDDVNPLIMSDSFEVLTASVREGAIASILPRRVVKSRGLESELFDITTSLQSNTEEQGKHNIVLAYLDRCDEKEALYLADTFRKQIEI